MTQTIEVDAVQVLDNPDLQELPSGQPGTAGVLAKFDPIKLQLAQLQAKVSSTVFDITTTAGMKTACELRRECVDTRVSAAKTYKALNAPLLAAQRGMRLIVEDIEAIVSPLEAKLDAEIKAQEAIKEAERKRKVAEEEARVKAIREKIQAIATLPAQAARQAAKGIAALDQGLAQLVVDEAAFGEFAPDVTELVAHIRQELSEMFVLAVDRESEAERVRLEGLRLLEAQARQAAVEVQRKRVDGIRQWPLNALGQTPEYIQNMLNLIPNCRATDYGELQEEALQAIDVTESRLNDLLADRLETERLVADQKQREQDLADQRQRDQDAADQRQRDADAAHAKLSQELKQQQDAFEAEKAEARRLKAVEDAKLVEARKLAEAQAKALEPAPAPAPVPAPAPEPVPEPVPVPVPVPASVVVKSATKAGTRPSDLAIVTAVSVRFGVSQSVACEWLRTFNADAILAAIVPAPAVAITFEDIPV